jgi:hypothetical protein
MQCVRKLSLYQVLLLVSTAWKKSINVGCTVSKDWLGIPFLVGRLPHTNDVLYRESSLSRDSRFPLIKEQRHDHNELIDLASHVVRKKSLVFFLSLFINTFASP